MFNASFDVLLYDLTSTYFEIDAGELPEGDKRRHGYSRDHRPDCPQVVIALVVTPEGLPLAYKILAFQLRQRRAHPAQILGEGPPARLLV
jgi:hypothetical protein